MNAPEDDPADDVEPTEEEWGEYERGRQIPHTHARPTNPAYTGAAHPDKRVHGPEICPHRCSVCEDGRHHWMENGFDPSDPYYGSADDPDRDLHNAIKAAGEMQAAAHYACKHCPAWCECDYVWDLEEGDDEDGLDVDEDTGEWVRPEELGGD